MFNEHIVKTCENYLQKGSTVYIEGSLQTRKYTDAQGVEKFTTEIVLQRFNGVLTMLGGKPQDDGGGRRDNQPNSQSSGQRESYDLNDDIPF